MVGIIYFCLLTLLTIGGSSSDIIERKYYLKDKFNLHELRLDSRVTPILYNLTIKPYLLPEDGNKQFTFEGDVGITVQSFYKDLYEVFFHSLDLKIWNVSLYDVNGTLVDIVPPEKVLYTKETQMTNVTFSVQLVKNLTYTIRIKYSGEIRSGSSGFFRSFYTDPQGKIKWYALTQLQRTNARTLFPCFDEPGYKANFQLNMFRRSRYNIKSNTHLLYSEPVGDDWYTDHFNVTPRMSTYLLAFIISEFEMRGDADYGIIVRPEYYNYTDFSFDAGQRLLKACNELFGKSYKEVGNEVLQFTSSAQFINNGMENWGLIVFSDDVLLSIPGYTDGWKEKEFTLRIISHELVHTWFGNSVTMGWWSWLWMNEGFGRYYEYFITHRVHPEYELDKQFIVNEMHSVLEFDGNENTDPLTSPDDLIQDTEQIELKVNKITYSKGACLLRMMHSLLGEDDFNSAIRSYFKKQEYRGVIPKDLYNEFLNLWKMNISEGFFKDWSMQSGYPVVIVNVTEDGQTFNLTQKRFSYTLDKKTSDSWHIPITYATSDNPNFDNLTTKDFFDPKISPHQIKLGKPVDWIVLNLRQSYYYRVFYDKKCLQKLRAALSVPGFSGIPVENRAQIVDDLFSFARAHYIGYLSVIKFMEDYLPNETEYLPWYAACDGLHRLTKKLPTKVMRHFVRYLFDITKKVYGKLGFKPKDSDTILDIYNRNQLLALLCKYGHEDCNEQASDMVKAIDNGHMNKPVPDFREILYCSAVRGGEYSIILKWYLLEKNTKEREKLLLGISCTKDFSIHYENVIMNLNTSVHEKIISIAQLSKENPENELRIFTLLTDEIDRLNETLGGSPIVATVITGATYQFSSNEELKLLSDFIRVKGNLFGSSKRDILLAARDDVKNRTQYIKKHFLPMLTYLNKRSHAKTATLSIPLHLILLGLLYLYRYCR